MKTLSNKIKSASLVEIVMAVMSTAIIAGLVMALISLVTSWVTGSTILI